MNENDGRPAVFLDRDGTLIESVHYLAQPEKIVLIDGVGCALNRLREQGYLLVLVTNQSAIGRGLLTENAYEAIHAEFCRQLRAFNIELDGHYFAPHAPNGTDRTIEEHPDRKPAPGMLLRAAKDLGIDLSRSWMIGDMISDVLAGRHAGCRASILVETGLDATNDAAKQTADFVVKTLDAAVDTILQMDGSNQNLSAQVNR